MEISYDEVAKGAKGKLYVHRLCSSDGRAKTVLRSALKRSECKELLDQLSAMPVQTQNPIINFCKAHAGYTLQKAASVELDVEDFDDEWESAFEYAEMEAHGGYVLESEKSGAEAAQLGKIKKSTFEWYKVCSRDGRLLLPDEYEIVMPCGKIEKRMKDKNNRDRVAIMEFLMSYYNSNYSNKKQKIYHDEE